MAASRWAASALRKAPFVENLTPIDRSMACSTISKKSRRIIGSPPPMLM
jgi:hypothetical protein